MLAEFKIIGYVGQINLRQTKSGGTSVYLSLAITDFYKGKKSTHWINNLVFNGKLGELAQKLCETGTLIYAGGTIKYTRNKDGSTQYLVADTIRVLKRSEMQEKRKLAETQSSPIQDEDVYESSEETETDLPY